jgi:putative transposase
LILLRLRSVPCARTPARPGSPGTGALAKCKERYEAEGKWYSGVDLPKLWNAEKRVDPALAWWRENSKCAYQEAFRDLGRALQDFTASKKGDRKGRRLGFPRFKKRGRCQEAFRLGSGKMRCCGASVMLPRLGTIRTHESTRKLARRVERGTARPASGPTPCTRPPATSPAGMRLSGPRT